MFTESVEAHILVVAELEQPRVAAGAVSGTRDAGEEFAAGGGLGDEQAVVGREGDGVAGFAGELGGEFGLAGVFPGLAAADGDAVHVAAEVFDSRGGGGGEGEIGGVADLVEIHREQIRLGVRCFPDEHQRGIMH